VSGPLLLEPVLRPDDAADLVIYAALWAGRFDEYERAIGR
jgi:hypothetical protein